MARRITPLPLFPIDPPQGFDATKLATVRANGSPFIANTANPATVPVPLPVILADVIGKYTERDRKLFRFLIHAAWDDLETKRRHSLPMQEIMRVFQEHGGDKNSVWIRESAKRLFDMRVEYKITCGDPRFDVSDDDAGEGMTRFLSGVHFSNMGSLTYEIPAMLIDIIKKPMRFARVRTHFVLGLSGKHAVTIYEILEAFVNKDDPSFTVSLEELRQWLNIKLDQYEDWKDLKRWVLRPALDQINANSEAAGFSVEMIPIKRGRDITHLQFKLTKSRSRVEQDSTLQGVASEVRFYRENPEQPRLSPGVILELSKRYPRIDVRAAEREWITWWSNKGKRPLKSPDAAFKAFVRKWAERRDAA